MTSLGTPCAWHIVESVERLNQGLLAYSRICFIINLRYKYISSYLISYLTDRAYVNNCNSSFIIIHWNKKYHSDVMMSRLFCQSGRVSWPRKQITVGISLLTTTQCKYTFFVSTSGQWWFTIYTTSDSFRHTVLLDHKIAGPDITVKIVSTCQHLEM